MPWYFWLIIGTVLYLLVGAFTGGFLNDTIMKEDEKYHGCLFLFALFLWPLFIGFIVGQVIHQVIRKED